MDAVGDLERQKAELTRALAGTRGELRRAKAAAKSRARAWELTAELRKSPLSVYVLGGYEVEPAVRFLRDMGQRRRWPSIPDAAAHRMVEDLFLAADLEEIAAVSAAPDPHDSPPMRAAMKAVEEWKLVVWTRMQNSERGVAPSTDAVLQRLAADRALAGHPCPHDRGTVADSPARMWATRWRRRWGGRSGTIRVVDELPVAERRDKAGVERLSTSFSVISRGRCARRLLRPRALRAPSPHPTQSSPTPRPYLHSYLVA